MKRRYELVYVVSPDATEDHCPAPHPVGESAAEEAMCGKTGPGLVGGHGSIQLLRIRGSSATVTTSERNPAISTRNATNIPMAAVALTSFF